MRNVLTITFIVFLTSIFCSKGHAQTKFQSCKRAVKSLMDFKISRPSVVTNENLDYMLTPQEEWSEESIEYILKKSKDKTYDFHKRQLNFVERFLKKMGFKFDMEDNTLFLLLQKQLHVLKDNKNITPYMVRSYIKFVRNLPARHRYRAIADMEHLADHTGKHIYSDFTNLILDMTEFFRPSHSSKHIRHYHSIQNRLRTYQFKVFNRLEKKYLRKGMSLLEAREKAAKNSFQERAAYQHKINQCRAPLKNKAHNKAKNRHRWIAISSGALFTGSAYALAHRNDDAGSERWWSLFQYEVGAKIAAQFIMSTIMANPTGTLALKAAKKYFASRGVGAGETVVYNNYMMDTTNFDNNLKEVLEDPERVERVKEMAKQFSPGEDGRSFQILKETTGYGYIPKEVRQEYRSETQIYRDMISEIESRYGDDAMEKFNDFYHDKDGSTSARLRLVKDQTKEIPMANNIQWDKLTDKDLEEPFVQAVVGSLVKNKMYEEEKGHFESMTTGDKGFDRFIFFAIADILQLFKDPLIDNYMYMTVCMGEDFEPKAAAAKARAAYFGNKLATEFVFYTLRKHAINM